MYIYVVSIVFNSIVFFGFNTLLSFSPSLFMSAVSLVNYLIFLAAVLTLIEQLCLSVQELLQT